MQVSKMCDANVAVSATCVKGRNNVGPENSAPGQFAATAPPGEIIAPPKRSPLRHPYRVRGNDCYETPDVAVHALLRVEHIPHVVWEPACGPGAIVRVLRATGRTVIASDLIDYGCPDSQARIDFLMEWRAPPGVECVLTNPPNRFAERFIQRAIMLCPLVIMLLRIELISGQRRSGVFDSGQLARIHAFRKRLPMMHRHGWQGPKADSQQDHASFVFERDHTGGAITDRISWDTEATP
jgi:hypothetical protein